MNEHEHTIRTEATFIRNGIMDYRFPALPKKSVTGLPITEHTGNREPAPESEYEYEIDLSWAFGLVRVPAKDSLFKNFKYEGLLEKNLNLKL